MYGKLESGELIKAPVYLTIQDQNIWNAPAEDYLSLGWFPVILEDYPECDESHYAESSWEQVDDEIHQVWTIVEIPVPEDDDELSDEQAMIVLMGGDL